MGCQPLAAIAQLQTRPRDSVRDLVRGMQSEIRETDLQPERACVLLARLTALLGNCNSEVTDAEIAYNEHLLACLNADEAANRAKIRAETSPEYRRKREARDTKELVVELVRSLKYILRSAEEEMRLSR
jgi:hypothetical protein